MKENSSNVNILNLLSYISLVIVALLIFLTKLLPLVGLEVGGTLINVLDTVKEIFVIIVIGVNSYRFVVGKAKWLNIVYWISVVLFVASVVLIWIK